MRATYLLLTDFERAEEWCRKVRRIFAGTGHVGLFLVGSALTRADYRDIDLRLILTDEAWDREWTDAVKTRYMNAALSTWGQRETGLPIDFQLQRMSTANASFGEGHPRNPMGVRDWAINHPAGGAFDVPGQTAAP